jgi:Tfp pilus assembly protein PilF
MERIEKLKAFLSENPSDNFVQHALALEYIKNGEDREAQKIFEDLLTRDPSYVGSYYHLGKLLEKTGNAAGAIKWYEQGMEAALKNGERRAYNELRGAFEELTS